MTHDDHRDSYWQPELRGERVSLRPLTAADLEPLFQSASDPLIWAQHSAKERYRREEFEKFFTGAMGCGGALAILDNATGRIIGSSRYYDHDAMSSSVVIGYTFLERAFWGGSFNAEVKSLMLRHAFAKVAIVQFHVSPGNVRSRRALERIGARVHSEAMIEVDGKPSERIVYVLSSSDMTISDSP
jgi:RimJ/RimL family protein N-acetyltransferase